MNTNILIPMFTVEGLGSYPTGVTSVRESIVFQDIDYWIGTGDLSAETGEHTYLEYQTWLEGQPAKTGVRLITKRSFLQRFSQVERISVRASEDPIIQDIYEDLKIASNINLDLPEVSQGLTYMVSQGILDEDRLSLLLADGTPYEEYKGL